MVKKNIIGILGYGNMGRALAGRWVAVAHVLAFDKDATKTDKIVPVKAAESLADMVIQANILVLALKPQDLPSVLSEISPLTASKSVISIAAGVPTAYLMKKLPAARIVRVMPNLAVAIAKGMSCLCPSRGAAGAELESALELFRRTGQTLVITEELMDAATAVCGSGPGFFYDFLRRRFPAGARIDHAAVNEFKEELKKAAQSIGFEDGDAGFLSENTVDGALAFFLCQQGVSLDELIERVASKGGTTSAGLKVLEAGGSLKNAVLAALNRARELSMTFK